MTSLAQVLATANPWGEFEHWSAFASVAGATVALLTAALVFRQIYLAKESLRLQSRTACVELRPGSARDASYDYIVLSNSRYLPAMVDLWLFNTGEKTATTARIFLWLPREWRFRGWDGKGVPRESCENQGFRLIGPDWLDEARYWNVSVDVSTPTYPGIEHLAHSFEVIVPVNSEHAFLWRVGYDDGITPPQHEPPGRFRFRLAAVAIRREGPNEEGQRGNSPPTTPLGPSQS